MFRGRKMVRKDDEVVRLENKILYHKRKYYDGEPELSDSEYDKLEDQLMILDPKNPILFMVGSPGGGDVIHEPRMLSCEKAKTVDDVISWADGRELYLGHKIDGLSLKLIYEKGRLVQAATRGNGLKGEDVTINVMKIQDIPKTIPEEKRIEIRGELYMTISEFDRINKSLNQQYSSPRNLAAGSLKQKNPSILDERALKFKAFDLLGLEGLTIDEMVELFHSWNFDKSDFKLIEKPDYQTISKIHQDIEKERNELDFEIDGIVFKFNDYNERKNAGSTEHHPKWQIALKFESKGEITELKGITWQVGRTGVLTPVAELEPIMVSGATISRATLHNLEFLVGINANIGDMIYVERSGDVIPKITSVEEKRNHKPITLPEVCPSCGLSVRKSGVNLICENRSCKEQILQKIHYWVKITEIDGLGPKSIEKLYDKKLVSHIGELYKLTEQELTDLLGKNGSKIFNNIQKALDLPFHVFLAGLGISTLGKKIGKILAENFSSFKELQDASIPTLTTIEYISDITADYIKKGVNDKEIYQPLFDNGVKIIYRTEKQQKRHLKPQKGSLTQYFDKNIKQDGSTHLSGLGKKIYVTGKIEGKSKKEIQDFVEQLGYEWSTSISGKLDLLVTGEKAGQKKLEKANALKIPIKTWKEFIKDFK
jgi:DNA ligase (NAD+)